MRYGADGIECVESGDTFDVWWEFVHNGCEHPGMQLVCERIANWSGVWSFRSALQQIDGNAFSSLLGEVPMVNGGMTVPVVSRQCLEELDAFDVSPGWPTFRLVDDDTGAVIAMNRTLEDTIVSDLPADYVVRFSLDGRIVVNHGRDDDHRVVFAASRFTQRRAVAGGETWVLSGDETPEVELPRAAVVTRGGNGLVAPARLRVDAVITLPAEFRSVVAALRRVFEASVAVDMPVHWC